jgi:hypothetical protein
MDTIGAGHRPASVAKPWVRALGGKESWFGITELQERTKIERQAADRASETALYFDCQLV